MPQWQLLQQLVIVERTQISWWDSSSHNQWNFSSGHSQDLLRIIEFPDASYRNNEDGSSQRGMTVLLSRVAWAINKRRNVIWQVWLIMKAKRLKRLCSPLPWLSCICIMKCFGSWQFLRGFWVDISGEVANIHMRTGAKNVVTTAGTIHLPEQKETIHVISMLRKEACSREYSWFCSYFNPK